MTMQGWTSLLSDAPKKDVEKGEYVVKPTKPKLSQNSLEVCTESLGNETGSKTSEAIGSFLEGIRETSSKARVYKDGKLKRCILPPPLPSINGCGGVRIERHTEDGRLLVMIQLVVASSQAAACFEAERENGRLKLRFKDMDMDMHMNMDMDMDCEEDDSITG